MITQIKSLTRLLLEKKLELKSGHLIKAASSVFSLPYEYD